MKMKRVLLTRWMVVTPTLSAVIPTLFEVRSDARFYKRNHKLTGCRIVQVKITEAPK